MGRGMGVCCWVDGGPCDKARDAVVLEEGDWDM